VSLEERAQEYASRCNPPQQHEATERVLLAARKYAYIYGYRAAIEDAARACDERELEHNRGRVRCAEKNQPRLGSDYRASGHESRLCAAAIRSLLEDGR
jgi:hypothetical protein